MRDHGEVRRRKPGGPGYEKVPGRKVWAKGAKVSGTEG